MGIGRINEVLLEDEEEIDVASEGSKRDVDAT